MKGILMPYYHNQRAYGGRNAGCQNQRPDNSGCMSQRPDIPGCMNQPPCQTPPATCPAQPSCSCETAPRPQPRPSCPIPNSCGDDTNPCCSLAVAGVVNQKSESPTYDIERALIVGTIYTELDKPFLREGGCKR